MKLRKFMKISETKFSSKNSNYSILIGLGAMKYLKKRIATTCPGAKKIALIFDKNIPEKLKKKVKFQTKNYEVHIYQYSVNEKLKSFNKVNQLNENLIKKNFNRNDVIIAIGGGVIGDFAGFVASILKRGINFINLPTTLLSQVDASIGGKTGINSRIGKNLIGTFYQPRLVISEIEFLKSLPKREMICGFAEVLKHSLICDKKFFNWIEKNAKKIIETRDRNIIKFAILKSCKIKISFVTKDEREKGNRAILNFGHTFAHGIEAASNFSKKINHGEAVLIGMFLATKFSRLKRICSISTLNKIIDFYKKNNLPRDLKKYSLDKSLNKIIWYMKSDKKNKDSRISLILLKHIGRTTKPDAIKISPKGMEKVLRKII
tara:strand:- start:12079 stop:13206 length:1128 start_codon:yes stop_codon:yes gene_type:complete